MQNDQYRRWTYVYTKKGSQIFTLQNSSKDTAHFELEKVDVDAEPKALESHSQKTFEPILRHYIM